jgi:hypothetical protein
MFCTFKLTFDVDIFTFFWLGNYFGYFSKNGHFPRSNAPWPPQTNKKRMKWVCWRSKSDLSSTTVRPEAGLLKKSSHLAPTLGVTKFMTINHRALSRYVVLHKSDLVVQQIDPCIICLSFINLVTLKAWAKYELEKEICVYLRLISQPALFCWHFLRFLVKQNSLLTSIFNY